MQVILSNRNWYNLIKSPVCIAIIIILRTDIFSDKQCIYFSRVFFCCDIKMTRRNLHHVIKKNCIFYIVGVLK